jgi:L-Ala-D/L-Glu epimerase
MELEVTPRTWALAAPFETAWGAIAERTILEVRLRGPDGPEGAGEAAPLEPYDGVPLEICAAALEAYRPLVADWDGVNGAALMDACREVADLPQALAGLDLALWDRAGRRAGRPVCELLADDVLRAVPVNATIAALDRAGAADAAARAVRAGFSCLKVKVGMGDDAGRLAAVRAAAGPSAVLRIDANGAWDVEEAEASLRHLHGAGLELVEEPVHGIAAMRALRERVPVRIAMDETAAEAGALASGAADAVCLKISRCGGVAGTLVAAALVRTTGAEVYLASTIDGPAGIAAALHVAAALRVELPCGLATLEQFEGLDAGPLTPDGGTIRVPELPGLGVKPPG